MKNILIISSSPRKNGNSETLAASFAKGAMENGNNVEIINLREKNYSFCRGCFACLTGGECVIKDDAAEIVKRMYNADVLVFVTPVYYYSVSGQLKTMLDRANPLYDSGYKFTKVYMLATAGEEEYGAVEGAKSTVQGWVDCFPRATLEDIIFAGGVTAAGDIAGQPVLNKAYEMGKSID